jgi:hypothetical protein
MRTKSAADVLSKSRSVKLTLRGGVGRVGVKAEALPGFLVPRMMALVSEEKVSYFCWSAGDNACH